MAKKFAVLPEVGATPEIIDAVEAALDAAAFGFTTRAHAAAVVKAFEGAPDARKVSRSTAWNAWAAMDAAIENRDFASAVKSLNIIYSGRP